MIETHANYSPMRGKTEVWVSVKEGDSRYVAGPLVMSRIDPGTVMGEPTINLDDDEARQLMDSLWAAGVRPTEIGTAGQLAAINRHLEDMRRLVFETPPLHTMSTGKGYGITGGINLCEAKL